MSQIRVYIEPLSEDFKLPTYAKKGDSGMDVCSTIDVDIYPNQTVIIPVGFKVAIPDGYEIQVRPRSGLSFKTPLRVSNSPGTVDAGFRDEIGVIMTNTSKYRTSTDYEYPCNAICEEIYNLESKGNQQGTYRVKKGDRIAQIVLQEVPKIKWEVIDDVTKIGQNRGGGFGSTGTKSE